MAASLDPYAVRGRFPALRREVDGHPAAYFDGPGGSQSPAEVAAAMAAYLDAGSSNLGGPFATSQEADAVVEAARAAMADFYNAARPEEIVFGQNMTSLTFAMSRALAKTWQPEDQIVLTRLDHDANVTPWVMAAEDRSVDVRWVDFDPDDGCTLDYDGMRNAIGPRTRLVAVTLASNAVGTIVDVRQVVGMARAHGALVYVDAVHFAPHRLIDVQAMDVDFLVASAYKFFGPHTGILYGKYEHLAAVEAYKVRPAPEDPPGKWETGTQSFESLAGVTATVDYLASLGDGDTRREAITDAMARTEHHEDALTRRFLKGIDEVEGIRLYGIHDDRPRTPTFAIAIDGWTPAEASEVLGDLGMFTWAGHYYAVEVMQRLGILDDGGLLRIGFLHYTTDAEVDRLLAALGVLASGEDPRESAEFQPTTLGDLEPYRAYDLGVLPDPRTVGRSQLADGLAEVVAVEGPVTTDRAYSVFVKAGGGMKVTKPVRDDMDWAVELLVEQGRLAVDEFVVSAPDAEDTERQVVLRRPKQPRVHLRELGERDLYKVPLSEVAALVAGLRRNHPEADGEELKRLTLEAYGLKRLTPLASRYLDAAFRLAGV